MKFLREMLGKIQVGATILCFALLIQAQQSAGRKDSNVLLPVSVWSKSEGFGQNIGLDDIQLFEGKTRIETISIGQTSDSLAVGILVDVSGSVGDSPGRIKNAVSGLKTFVEKSRIGNEYFLIAFSDRQQVLADRAIDPAAIAKALDEVAELNTKGNTVFYDTLKIGFDRLERSPLQKVLIVVSDGQDTSSKESDFSEVRKRAKRENVLLYFVNMATFNEYGSAIGLQAMDFSQQLAEVTGGRYFEANTVEKAKTAFEELAAELKNQYSLTVRLSPSPNELRWRELKLKLATGSKLNKKEIRLRTRTGIYF